MYNNGSERGIFILTVRKCRLQMRIMYGLLIAIEIILMGICSYKAMNKKGRLAKIVFIYEAVAAFCGIVFLVYIYVPGITITTLLQEPYIDML